MHRILGVLLLCVSGSVWSEDCHVIVKKDALVKKVVDGKEAFVIAVQDVKPDQCFKPVETGQQIKKLQRQSPTGRSLQTKPGSPAKTQQRL